MVDVEVWLRPGAEWDASRVKADHGAVTVHTSRSGFTAWVKVPVAELERLSRHPDIVHVTNPPVPAYLEATGPELTGASNHYHTRGILGAGVSIAVIDGGYAGLREAQDAGALPSDVVLVNLTDSAPDLGSDGQQNSHGTSVAEIVHKMAPGASLVLYKIDNSNQLKAAVEDCIGRGVRIINHSMAWFNSSFYDGTGVINEIVEVAAAAGILWVNSAGNYAQRHYRGEFKDNDDDGWHNFEGQDETITITLSEGQSVRIALTWNAWGSFDSDYDLYLFRDLSPGSEPVCSSEAWQSEGRPPTEILRDCTAAEAGVHHIAVRRKEGTRSHNLALFVITGPALKEHSSIEGSIPDPTTRAAFTVGAIEMPSWDSGEAASYSSRGPTSDGLLKPDLCAPSGVETSATERGSTRFHGTSAAAPHVAGAAALILEESNDLSPFDLRVVLEANATGPDPDTRTNACGAGRLNLQSPMARPDIRLSSQVRLLQPPPYSIGQEVTVQFSIVNAGNGCMHLAELFVVGYRADGEIVGFPNHTNIVLCEGKSYDYRGSLKIPGAGFYRFLPAYRTFDGTWNNNVPRGGWPGPLTITVLDGGRILRAAVTTRTAPAQGCATPPVFSVFYTDTAQIYAWFLIEGVVSGDRFSIEWVDPNDNAFQSAIWDPSPSGNRCYTAWIEPVKADLSARIGDWRARISLNGMVILELPFRLLPPQPQPATLSSLTISSSSVMGGQSVTGRITLTANAPSSGLTVRLSSSHTSARVPFSITIPAGQSTATFTIETSVVSAEVSATITATFGSVSRSAVLEIRPAGPAPSIFRNRSFVIEGTANLEGRTIRFRITMGPLADMYILEMNNSLDFTSMIVLALFFEGARLTSNSITFDRVQPVASLYGNLNRSLQLETIMSGSITLSADTAVVGAPVRGTLRFSTASRSLETSLTGTIIDVRSF
jgi:hypothetical protein